MKELVFDFNTKLPQLKAEIIRSRLPLLGIGGAGIGGAPRTTVFFADSLPDEQLPNVRAMVERFRI